MDQAHFDHPLNIVVGCGRIIYVDLYKSWALPGGTYTKNQEIAESTARLIDDLTRQYQERHKWD